MVQVSDDKGVLAVRAKLRMAAALGSLCQLLEAGTLIDMAYKEAQGNFGDIDNLTLE